MRQQIKMYDKCSINCNNAMIRFCNLLCLSKEKSHVAVMGRGFMIGLTNTAIIL